MNDGARGEESPKMNSAQMHRPWWREPMVWLVIGGPAVVVVAAICTAVIAVKYADPVLDTQAQPTAVQSRNHAVTPGGAPSKP